MPKSIRRATLEPLEPRSLFSVTLYVAPQGSDDASGLDAAHAWRHIQKAFSSAPAGSTVNVLPGTYNENLELKVSGNASAGFITFQARGPIGSVVVNGRGGANVIHLEDRNYVRIKGFDIRSRGSVHDGSGIRLEGFGSHVELLGNRIHRIHGSDAMGITIYGSSTAGIRDLTIDGNEIYDCQASRSEALTLNGNVSRFAVTNNYVHDVNNIGIDFIGGEGMTSNPTTDTARDGVCAGNRVVRAHSSVDHAAAGIYVDGGKNITLERNIVESCDQGIEIGSEHRGRVTSGIVVRDNLVFNNDRAGISIGGFDTSVGRVENCKFLNNTLYQNVRKKGYFGEFTLNHGSNNTIRNNLIVANGAGHMVYAIVPISNYRLDYNLYYSAAGAKNASFVLNDEETDGFANYRSASRQDANSIFADPKLRNPAGRDFHPNAASPAIDAGASFFTPAKGETDLDGRPRVRRSSVDLGAYELQ